MENIRPPTVCCHSCSNQENEENSYPQTMRISRAKQEVFHSDRRIFITVLAITAVGKLSLELNEINVLQWQVVCNGLVIR